MGLDIVELFMAIEDEFDLEIPPADVPDLVRLGTIQDYLVNALRLRGETSSEEQIWTRLGMVVRRELGTHPDQLTREAHLIHDLGAD